MLANKLKNSLQALIHAKIPVFIWGNPGVGKSSLVKQIASENNMRFIDLRLSLLDPTDLRGIPFFEQETKKAVWAKPEFLPDMNSQEFGILFLDEINSAPPTIQAAAYQLILDRKIGEYILPDGFAIVAAGNYETDRGVTYRMPTPLANRFVHLNFDLDFQVWKEWAYKSNIDHRIIAFLNYKQENLFTFDPKGTSKSFATPRSWSFVNDILKSNLNEELYLQVVGGAVGEQTAQEFLNFCNVMNELPNLQDILESKTVDLPQSNSAWYALCVGLVYAIKNNYKQQYLDNILEFSHQIPSEFSVMLIRDIQKEGIAVEHSSKWDAWVDTHGFLLL